MTHPSGHLRKLRFHVLATGTINWLPIWPSGVFTRMVSETRTPYYFPSQHARAVCASARGSAILSYNHEDSYVSRTVHTHISTYAKRNEPDHPVIIIQ